MTDRDHATSGRALLRRLVLPVRRVVAPAALELPGQVSALTAELAALREENVALRARAAESEGRLAALDARTGELHDGLAEARRLNIRLAELTDVVTELVLPLHDREIDQARLRTLRPETR